MADILECVKTGVDIERFRDLLNAEKKQNLVIGHGDLQYTLLHIAVQNGGKNLQKREDFLQFARELIKFGANVNAIDKFERTPLHLAVSYRDFNMIELLLENNAMINLQDANGNTVLHYASSKCTADCNCRQHTSADLDLNILKLLLNNGADGNIRNFEGETALIRAVQFQTFCIVQELLNKNAMVNIRDRRGNYPMYYALTKQEVDVRLVVELRRREASFIPEKCRHFTPLCLYIYRLKRTSSRVEMEKAKFVFKLFALNYDLIENGIICPLNDIILANECRLPKYIELCSKEVKQMQEDQLAPDYKVYDIALRGVFYAPRRNDHIPKGVLDEVVSKLMRGHYPMYSEWIIEGICRPFLKERFATACSKITERRDFFNQRELYLLSDYLSNVDMLNMMVSCRKL